MGFRYNDPFQRASQRDSLDRRIDEAIAWGMPDNWSMGMNSSAFIKLLYECRAEIHYLRQLLKEAHKAP